ncbi:olfactory receptor 1020-like [Microcaecilia unicolor]|uniref:Olfactory receptor n=1 Tax=Microcaecilia unicolor TaxID=1415580 RepID=A0A6P7X7V6_9AMPH|nr:olfactory receptor 1020-like [Microcaecilia unicolor]
MEDKNQTSITEIILLGFSDLSKLQNLLFTAFLAMYALTLLGNIGIIILIRIDPQLHTPMYLFLSNLSFVDICYSSTVTPRALANFITEKKSMSLIGCATQFYFIAMLASAECFLLSMMAYDRYIAICNPLLYTAVMTKKVCIQLLGNAYIISLTYSLIQTGNIFSMSFCGSNKINHFYCDAPPLLKLSCSDTFFNEIILSTFASIVTLLNAVAIFLSYIYIISAILKIRSATGRQKAFSTCASHFMTVVLFFGTLVFMYVSPSSRYSLNKNRLTSVIYTMVIPMVNPMIYSLRNNDVKRALKKVLDKKLNF